MKWSSPTIFRADLFRFSRLSRSTFPRFHYSSLKRPSSAVRQLARFVEYVRHDDSYTVVQTPGAIQNLYMHLAEHSELNCLAASQLSTLLLFFGHLALRRPRAIDHIYQYGRVIDIASEMRPKEHSSAPFWSMVQRIGNDMRALDMPLVDADHSWMLRAYITNMHSFDEPELQLDDPRIPWAIEARHHYIQIQHLPVWELHTMYFGCMLQMPPEYHRTSDLHQHLLDSLKTFPIISDRFFTVMVHILSKHYHVITDEDKDQLLAVLRSRCATFFRTKWKEVALSMRPGPSWTGVNPIMSMFKDAFLGRRSHDWVSCQLNAILSSRRPKNSQWDAVMFFAHYFANDNVAQETLHSAMEEIDTPISLSSPQSPAIPPSVPAHIKNILFLAELQRNLNQLDVSERLPIQSFWHLVTRVWAQWQSKEFQTAERVPLVVERSVLSMFFRLSHYTYDRPFFDNLIRYCDGKELWISPPSEPDQVILHTQFLQLVADFAVALFLHEGGRVCCSWPKLFRMVWYHVPSAQPMHLQVIPRMIEPLARLGAVSEAQDLFAFFKKKRPTAQITPDTAYSLSVALANAEKNGKEHLFEAIPFLHKRYRLPSPRLVVLLESILHSIVRNDVRYLPGEHVKLLVIVLSLQVDALDKLQPETRQVLPRCLSVLIRSPYHKTTWRLVKSLYSHDAAVFNGENLLGLTDTLLDVQQWKAASIVHGMARNNFKSGVISGEIYHQLHRQILFALCKYNAFQLARKVYESLAPGIQRSPMESIARIVDFRLNRGVGNARLRLSGGQIDQLDMIVKGRSLGIVKSVMLVLVNAGRVQHAERIMRDTFETMEGLDDDDRTHLCTILMQGLLAGRYARPEQKFRGRIALSHAHIRGIVRSLEEKYDFKMGRVGVNVVLRAWMLNRSSRGLGRLSSSNIHRMFDYMLVNTPEISKILGRRLYRNNRKGGLSNIGLFGSPKQRGKVTLEKIGLNSLPAVSSHKEDIAPMLGTFIQAMKRRRDWNGSKLAKATYVTLDILASHDPSRLEWKEVKAVVKPLERKNRVKPRFRGRKSLRRKHRTLHT